MSTILGHTLGTPHLDLSAAMDLFARSMLDGIEIIWQDDYRCALPESADGALLNSTLKRARDAGLVVGCLTPYITGINSLDDDERSRDVARFEKAIAHAATLECSRMRVYGGKLLGDEPTDQVTEQWARLIESLQHLGAIAERTGVTLTVENHFSTMTVSASQTAQLIAEVGLRSVQALYDQANLAFTHKEGFEEAISLQAGAIGHVHVKDLEFIDPDRQLRTGAVASIAESDRVHYSRMIGDGVLDWPAILRALAATGYDGSYSLEYEYRWNPQDLPAPEVGFPESARRLRASLGALHAPVSSGR